MVFKNKREYKASREGERCCCYVVSGKERKTFNFINIFMSWTLGIIFNILKIINNSKKARNIKKQRNNNYYAVYVNARVG